MKWDRRKTTVASVHIGERALLRTGLSSPVKPTISTRTRTTLPVCSSLSC
ncbi:hypothetical protein KCP73_19335 [Salmonella enterica subsp. enterica]|nr:hypothetical protein KCP73_19335 [Salmonella enterica subsp. enterica]